MKRLILLPLALAACAKPDVPPPGMQIETVEVIKEVQRPCKVTMPVAPAPLGVLPSDAVAALAVTGAKLVEYAGEGKYVDRLESALRICTKP